MRGATLDAGALIAFERGSRPAVALIARAVERDVRLAVPAGAVAHVWRDGSRQARLSRLLGSTVVEVVALDDAAARAAGQICGVCGTSDVVDASVVLCAAERGHAIVTGDARDLRRLDPSIEIIVV